MQSAGECGAAVSVFMVLCVLLAPCSVMLLEHVIQSKIYEFTLIGVKTQVAIELGACTFACVYVIICGVYGNVVPMKRSLVACAVSCIHMQRPSLPAIIPACMTHVVHVRASGTRITACIDPGTHDKLAV